MRSLSKVAVSKEYDILWCRNCGATYAIEHEWFTNGRGPGYGFQETLEPIIPHCCLAISLRAGGPPYLPDTQDYVKIIAIIDTIHKAKVRDIKKDRIRFILEDDQ